MSIVEKALNNIKSSLENVAGYSERCKVINIVVADIFNQHNIIPSSKEAYEFFSEMNEEGCGFFQEEAKEIYRLMEIRK